MSDTDDAIAAWLKEFPGTIPHPFDLTPRLYTHAQLYSGYQPGAADSWPQTYDQRAYAWFYDVSLQAPRRLDFGQALAARLHDTSIQQHVDAYLEATPGKVVGFMGGHEARRASDDFRTTALLARDLRRKGLKIVTGGGPGLMEAANFGAFLAGFSDDAFEPSLATLRSQEFERNDPTPWIDSACDVLDALLGDWKHDAPDPLSQNLGIPTWLYGNEPPNLFATAIAKYFYNSVREDGLVSVASGGLVFAPGSAGTVQEVFQNANINYYTAQRPTPMIFLGKAFWDPARYDGPISTPHPKPVFPLVEKLASDRGHDSDFLKSLLISDDIAQIAKFLTDFAATATPTVAEERLVGKAPALMRRPSNAPSCKE